MRRFSADDWAGIVCVFVGLAVGIGSLLSSGTTAPQVPRWLWGAAYAAFLALFLLLGSGGPRREVLYTAVAVQVALGGFLVISSPHAGWLSVLLVFCAAMSTYVVPVSGTAAIVGVNCLFIGIATSRVTTSASAIALTVAINLALQVATVLSTIALRHERAMREQLTQAQAELRAAAMLRDEAARADERLAIARELHDLLGHQLTVLTLELEAASHREGPQVVEHVGRARALSRELLSDVRATVGELRYRAPDLRQSLEGIADLVSEPRVEVSVADDVRAAEPQTIALLRVAQEVLTNAIRHSGATTLRIDVTTEPRCGVELTASDDGTGADLIVPGNGLRGMQERVHRLGGRIEFDGTSGFAVRVWLAKG